MPDWSLEGSIKPATPLALPLPPAPSATLSDPQKGGDPLAIEAHAAALAHFREQVQCDLQYLYCHLIRWVAVHLWLDLRLSMSCLWPLLSSL